MRRSLLAPLCCFPMLAANYSATRVVIDGSDVIRLFDAAAQTEVLVVPSFGNNAYSMKVKGHEVFWSPAKSLAEWKSKPALAGNPFLWPWANRIEGGAYTVNGKRYVLNSDLGNVRKDANQNPIHGLAMFTTAWKVTNVQAGDDEAETTSQLDFYRHPNWMAQFPFAHVVTMTHRLRGGVLEVETVVENLSTQPLPISLGFHPYFQLTDSPRDDWKVHLAAREHVALSPKLVPTGEKKTVPFADPVALRGSQLDDVFTGLVRENTGRAVFWVQGKSQRISVEYGPNYPVAVVYAPPGREFICFEPMAGVTNVFNLAHEGKFPLQTVAPSAQWRESFWIRPSGY